MSDNRLTVGVVGLGRLGRAVVDACGRQGVDVVLTATRAGGWRIADTPTVLVDTSGPDALDAVVEYCDGNGVALVACVSDLDDRQWCRIEDLARRVPVVRATNLAVGHYVQSRLAEFLASLRIPEVFATETAIRERHPAVKRHRPSATAVELARVLSGAEVAEICSQRCGPPVSEHEVMWTWSAETLVLRHSVVSLAAAAAGAVVAARWAARHECGLVPMRAVFDDLIAGAAT